ncbi:MAG: T9SS type A sorting domain-containing protein [Bacteroidales bacterium]|jgi:uncharacterized protein (TIGR02145 family)|nr:T9SS type A sorting domain-containing protein [Bacteroidales bacterium]
MKTLYLFLLITIVFEANRTKAQTTVTDYDGNIYNTVVIGDQTWLKENIKSLHYTDGTLIPGAAAYNNNDSLANIYGRLYSWNATVRDSIATQVQGVCPNSWHVASFAEWTMLENFLGGYSVAGGKLKDTTSGMWNDPNTGATNSSGFTALPAGEYDAYYTPNVFQYLHESAVFWTSTQYNATKAKEKYMMYNDEGCLSYNWYKVMKYSIRCVKTVTTNLSPYLNNSRLKIINPASDKLQFTYDGTIDLESIEIYNMQGQLIKTEVFSNSPVYISLQGLKQGVYIAKFIIGKDVFVTKFNKVE